MRDLSEILGLFGLEDFEIREVDEHWGGRNKVFICREDGENRFVIRLSETGDRTLEEYLAETEYVHYLFEHGADVANVLPSKNGRFVECIESGEGKTFVSVFQFAKGMLISDNGYRYIEGVPITEYFYNTGKVLGKIHRLSKNYCGEHKRISYFDKYNEEYISVLIPDKYETLKKAIYKQLAKFREIPCSRENFGMVHFDFSDGNYHIDMEDGKITVFDFDNCMNCWYMFDLANLWTHGVGWFFGVEDREERRKGMKKYFDTVISGYRSETEIEDSMLEKLSLFINMVLIENIVDEFECCKLVGEEVDFEDIEDAANALTNEIEYAGFFE